MIKTRCLVMFRLAQSWLIYVKLEQVDAEINIVSRLGSIDRSLGSINQKSDQMHFSAEFQLNPNLFKTFRVLCFFPRYIRHPSHVLVLLILLFV